MPNMPNMPNSKESKRDKTKRLANRRPKYCKRQLARMYLEEMHDNTPAPKKARNWSHDGFTDHAVAILTKLELELGLSSIHRVREYLEHDGYDEMGPWSNIFDLLIDTRDNKTLRYHREHWFYGKCEGSGKDYTPLPIAYIRSTNTCIAYY